MLFIKSPPLFLLLLLLSAVTAAADNTYTLPRRTQADNCQEQPANGGRNGDECYSVDVITCRTSTNSGCTSLEGTYDYYLQTTVAPRLDLYTVELSANTCNENCFVQTTDYDNGRTMTFRCSINADGTTIQFNSQHPRAIPIFGQDPQQFVFGEPQAYLTLRRNQDHCDYIDQSAAPSVAKSQSPTTSPTDAAAPPTTVPSSSLTLQPTNVPVQTAVPSLVTTVRPSFGPVAIPFTSAPTAADISTPIPTAAGGEETPSPTTPSTPQPTTNETPAPTTTPNTPAPTTGGATSAPTSTASAPGPTAASATLAPTQSSTTLGSTAVTSIPSLVATSSPSMDTTAIPTAAGSENTSSPTTPSTPQPTTSQTPAPTTSATTPAPTTGGVTPAPTASTPAPTATATLAPTQSSTTLGPTAGETPIPSLDTTLSPSMDTTATDTSSLVPSSFQTETIAPTETITTTMTPSTLVVLPPISVPTVPMPAPPTTCYSIIDIPTCLDPNTLGANTTCDDEDNAAEVDVVVCPNQVLGDNGSCVEIEAYYDYGGGDEGNNPTTTVEISTSVGCQDIDDYCAVTVNGRTCNHCLVQAVDGTNNLGQLVTLLEDCGNILFWDLAPINQTIYITEGIGYFQLQQDGPGRCDFDAPHIAPTTSPSSNTGTLTPSTTTTPTATLAPSAILFDAEECYLGLDIPGCYEFNSTTTVVTFDCDDDDDCYNVDIALSAQVYDNDCEELEATYIYGEGNPNITIITFQSCSSSRRNNNTCEVRIDDLVCMDCQMESDGLGSTDFQKVIVGESCSELLDGYLPPREQAIPFFSAGVGYLQLSEDKAVCYWSTMLPSGTMATSSSSSPSTNAPSSPPAFDDVTFAPSEVPLITRNRGGDAITTDDKFSNTATDTKVLTLKPQFTLIFFNGHQEDQAPESNEISILWQRTEDFLQEILSEHYGTMLQGIKLEEKREDYQVQPEHHFEISFKVHITLDASLVVQGQVAADLLADSTNLQHYVGKYARFTDDDQTIINGLFYYTHTVRARIVHGKLADGSTNV